MSLEFMVDFYIKVIGFLATLGIGFICGYIYGNKTTDHQRHAWHGQAVVGGCL
jgi:hypothetical protein